MGCDGEVCIGWGDCVTNEFQHGDLVNLHEGFDLDHGFLVDMVDSFGNVRIVTWVKADELRYF